MTQEPAPECDGSRDCGCEPQPPGVTTMPFGDLLNLMARRFAEANGYEGEIPDFSKDWEEAAGSGDK